MSGPRSWFRVDVRRRDDVTDVEAGGGWVALAVGAVLVLTFLLGRASVLL